jgi:hypothetical protein
MELSERDLKNIEKMRVKYEEGRNSSGNIDWSVMKGYFRDEGDGSVGIGSSILQFEIRSDTANEEDMKFIKWLILQAIKEWAVGCVHDEIDDEEENKAMKELYGNEQ